MIYTSRSRIETFLDCPRKGYISYLWDNRGLTKRSASVYLSTGTFTHVGLEHIFRQVLAKEELNIDYAVELALFAYAKEIGLRGFDLEEGEDKNNEKYIIAEQCALVEAFIRAFAIRVLPDILNRFKIIDVEREEIAINSNLVMQGRIDVILEEITTNDLYIVSFKTAAQWDRRQEKSNEHDNQGLSETWILEHRLREENQLIDHLITHVGFEGLPFDVEPKIKAATGKYLSYIDKFRKNEKVMGVIMIYLLKGKRYESFSHPGRWEQHSPLIRAYRKLVGTTYEYAPSLYFNNPSNKSGKGRLGKGWEPFTVWDCEEVGGIKGWIERLADPNINVGMGEDVIANSFKIPAPYFRNQEHIDSWVRQAKQIEQDIQTKLLLVVNNPTVPYSNLSLAEKLDYTFPQRRKGCHYPVDCEMLDICYNSEIFNDPIGSGKYQYRKPHHKVELEAHERFYSISEMDNKEENKRIKEQIKENGSSKSYVVSTIQGNGNIQNAGEEVVILDEEIIIDE
jgi:hypothetical protein